MTGSWGSFGGSPPSVSGLYFIEYFLSEEISMKGALCVILQNAVLQFICMQSESLKKMKGKIQLQLILIYYYYYYIPASGLELSAIYSLKSESDTKKTIHTNPFFPFPSSCHLPSHMHAESSIWECEEENCLNNFEDPVFLTGPDSVHQAPQNTYTGLEKSQLEHWNKTPQHRYVAFI